MVKIIVVFLKKKLWCHVCCSYLVQAKELQDSLSGENTELKCKSEQMLTCWALLYCCSFWQTTVCVFWWSETLVNLFLMFSSFWIFNNLKNKHTVTKMRVLHRQETEPKEFKAVLSMFCIRFTAFTIYTESGKFQHHFN